jgi:hypothetical protein
MGLYGATPQQWQLIVRHRRTCKTIHGLKIKFGEADIAPPSDDVLKKQFLEPPPHNESSASSVVSRGALLGFLQARRYEAMQKPLAPKTLYLIAQTDIAPDSEANDWMTAWCTEAWFDAFCTLADTFVGMLDATHGITERRPGMLRKNVELTTTFWGHVAAAYTIGKHNKKGKLKKFRPSFQPDCMVMSFTEKGASSEFAIVSFRNFVHRRRPDLYARFLGPEKVRFVLLDGALGGHNAVRDTLGATMSQYVLGPYGRPRANQKCLLVKCFTHMVRNALEPGQKDGGWTLLKCPDKATKKKVATILKKYLTFICQKLPIVLFDIFIRKFDYALRHRTVTYPSGGTRHPQPDWADYFLVNKLEDLEMPTPCGDTVTLKNASWRGGPDFYDATYPSTNAEESFNWVVKADLKKVHEELVQQGLATHQDPSLPGLIPKMEASIALRRARRREFQIKERRAVPCTVDENLRDGCKAYSDVRSPVQGIPKRRFAQGAFEHIRKVGSP